MNPSVLFQSHSRKSRTGICYQWFCLLPIKLGDVIMSCFITHLICSNKNFTLRLYYPYRTPPPLPTHTHTHTHKYVTFEYFCLPVFLPTLHQQHTPLQRHPPAIVISSHILHSHTSQGSICKLVSFIILFFPNEEMQPMQYFPCQVLEPNHDNNPEVTHNTKNEKVLNHPSDWICRAKM